MDASVRVWNLQTGECQHVLTGHTSLVGLLGLSPSYLVSAAADSTLRIWDPDTGELRHTLAAHTGAITCFQHDEFKVLSGSDGNLKMWNVRDGTVVRDLLTGITGVWQVVFEGRWVVAASNRNDTTVLDVWDFGLENDDDWVGEPPGGLYDEDIFSDEEEEDEGYSLLKAKHAVEEDEEQEQADIDAMDEDLIASSDSDSAEYDENGEGQIRRPEVDNTDDVEILDASSEGVDASRWAPQATVSVSSLTTGGPSSASSSSNSRPQRPLASSRRRQHSPPPAAAGGGSSLGGTMRTAPPTNDETPTAPRRRQQFHGHPTRRR